MRLTIPLYIETRPDPSGGPTRHHVRPLFHSAPTRADEDLFKAQQRLVGDLQLYLMRVGQFPRHDQLASWNFSPEIEQHRIDVAIELRRRVVRARFFVAVFRSLGRRLAFCPSLPSLWFEVLRNQTLAYRAGEALTQYFRKQEQEADDEEDVQPELYALQGTAWTTSVELDVEVMQSFPDPARQLQALLGAADVSDGSLELRNCGRCLNWLYPSGLEQAYSRDHEVLELERRMLSADRRPILLLGRRLSGKTAIVHEYVSRITSRRQSPYSSKRNVWLLSPQRLISGMSYVGQWESRLLAILKEAAKRNHVLYFDDLPGLLQAGKSRDSSLSMGQVMRPYLERREVRVLGEITPESWRILREQDRPLADLFDVLPVPETDNETTARIVLATRRALEQEFRCRFSLDSLPAILEIERRYSPDAAFPGKGVRFLKDLALIRRGEEVTRDHVLDEFHRRSGLASRFLDPRKRLQRDEIVTALTTEVVGQPGPVAAVADILSIAKARLNDTGRPMGSLLFVGPTGVGKTQLARAAARFLFEDANRILRFDLNEYITRGSAARLVGTFDAPDGLLTGAVRRQPFAVVLLDEIEKAHPEVFDVLLQVLGEGRLSDGLGRTVSFSNTVIVMTSNLGVRENSQRLGFAGVAPPGDHVWQKAVERFFRPEFVNRIDRIVPFQQLSRDVIEQVARVLITEMLRRDGLIRRRCILTIEPLALDRAVDAGYSPTLGARSLKRSLEQMLIQPAGRQLAAYRPETLTQLHLYPSTTGISAQIHRLGDAETPDNCVALAVVPAPSMLRERADRFVARIETAIAEDRPRGPISSGQVSERQRGYFLLQERCRQLRDRIRMLMERSHSASSGFETAMPVPRQSRKATSNRLWVLENARFNQLRDAAAFHDSLQDLFNEAAAVGEADVTLQSILYEAALTEVELRTFQAQTPTRIGLCLRPLDGQSSAGAHDLAARIHKVLSTPVKPGELDLGVDCAIAGNREQPVALLEFTGLAAVALAGAEVGIHLDTLSESQLLAIQVLPIPLGEGESLVEVWHAIQANRSRWLEQLSQDEAAIEDDPFKPGSVIRIYESWGLTLDMRTGDMTEGTPSAAAWKRFLLGALELPAEFRDVPAADGKLQPKQ
jgi:ATP-dependent Clp protease ATP-binding subunit ClpC